MQKTTNFDIAVPKARILLDPGQAYRCTPLRIWEVAYFLKCPVIGMCLTFDEQKRLLKKSGVSTKRKNAFEIHEVLVGSSEKENALSRRMDNLFNRKYGDEFAPLFELGIKEFMEHWRSAFEAGGSPGLIWSAASRRVMPETDRSEIFGMIHMAMHRGVEQYMRLKRNISEKNEEIASLRGDLKTSSRAGRVFRREAEKSARLMRDLESNLAGIREENGRLKELVAGSEAVRKAEDLERENQRLKRRMEGMKKLSISSRSRIDSLGEKNRRLSKELEREREINAAFKLEAGEIMAELSCLNRCDKNCPSFDLCKKRVLIVGGITRMESLYRRLIEGIGGIFEYHDGYMKGGARGLENRFLRADLVLCPVSCNSHAACSTVKNLAKKHNKPVHMLANSSLSAITQVIRKAGDTQGPIN